MARAEGRGRHLPGWLILGPLLVVGLVALRGLSRHMALSGFTTVDAARSRLVAAEASPQEPAAWIDPRWEEELRLSLAQLGSFETDDSSARETLVNEVAGLSFVAEVKPARVIWPDGLDLAVRLRRPAACIRTAGGFLPVATDGTLLSGAWGLPPRVQGVWLPVLGPPERSFEPALPGMHLTEPQDLDALEVAVSLGQHLSPAAHDLLGRIAIDARSADQASVEEPGIRLLLEDGRLVLFGRRAGSGEPGELPVALKWASLERALELLRPGPDRLDWDLLDVRWDVADLRPRGAGVEGGEGGR